MYIIRTDREQIIEIHRSDYDVALKIYEDRCALLDRTVKLIELIGKTRKVLKEYKHK